MVLWCCQQLRTTATQMELNLHTALSWSKAVWCLRQLSKVANLESVCHLTWRLHPTSQAIYPYPRGRRWGQTDWRSRELAIVTRYNNKVTMNPCWRVWLETKCRYRRVDIIFPNARISRGSPEKTKNYSCYYHNLHNYKRECTFCLIKTWRNGSTVKGSSRESEVIPSSHVR